MKMYELLEVYPDMKQLTNLDLSKREVKNVTVIDSPDLFREAGEHELFVTSGYICSGSDEILKSYIETWAKGNVCGVGIKVDRFIKKIPDEIIEYANSLSFPIIYIPNKYGFSDIILPIMDMSLTQQVSQIKRSNEIISELIRLGIADNDISSILDYLFDILDCSFIYFDYIKDQQFNRGEKELLKGSKDYYEYTVDFNTEKIGKFILNLTAKEISIIQRVAVEHAANVMVLLHKEKIIAEKAGKNIKQELVLDLCTGNIKSREEIYIRSKLNGWSMKENIMVAIFDIDDYKKTTVNLNEKSSIIEQTKSNMFKYLRSRLLDLGLTYYTYQYSDFIIILFEENDIFTQENIWKIEDLSKKSFEKFGFSYTIGIGKLVNQFKDIKESYKEAINSIKIGRMMKGLGKIHFYKDVEIFSILSNAIDDDNLAKNMTQPIEILRNYDKDKGTEYLDFLEVLINNSWNLKKSAEQAYIHYNTAKYRELKIQEITGLSFDEATSKFQLELALRLSLINFKN